MFALYLRQLYRTSDRIIVRTLRNRKFEPKGPNPGLDNRIKAFESDGLPIKEQDLEEYVEQSESDFYNVGEVYNEHMNETLIGKYELRHRIVKEKYFKENMPSLLTWSEKEQIRHLSATEPDEWTPEKIAESFPVTVPMVKKLLKYAWKPASEQRIARHDASVMRNWKELKEGSFDIPQELRKHFLKFSDRTIPPLRKTSIKIDVTKEEDLGEFESIVKRCAAKETPSGNNNEASVTAINVRPSSNEEEKRSIKIKKDTKMLTLDELTTKIKKRLEEGNRVDMGDRIIVDTIQANKNVTSNEDITSEVELYSDNIEKNSIAEYSENDQNKNDPKEVMNYPERIRIPKKAYKKSVTYKVNDCYYDHDGRFLYRVLGMSN